jgi:hypothetical protein
MWFRNDQASPNSWHESWGAPVRDAISRASARAAGLALWEATFGASQRELDELTALGNQLRPLLREAGEQRALSKVSYGLTYALRPTTTGDLELADEMIAAARAAGDPVLEIEGIMHRGRMVLALGGPRRSSRLGSWRASPASTGSSCSSTSSGCAPRSNWDAASRSTG